MQDRNTEINEAVRAAEQTLAHLYRAQKCLSSAGNWGIVDMLGGGILSTFIKRGKMGDAEMELSAAKSAMRQLAKEMRDVNDVADLHIEMDDFLGFADYFFDGVIADWMIQSRIANAREQVERAINEVERLRTQLTGMLA